jgi:hypothetical protein
MWMSDILAVCLFMRVATIYPRRSQNRSARAPVNGKDPDANAGVAANKRSRRFRPNSSHHHSAPAPGSSLDVRMLHREPILRRDRRMRSVVLYDALADGKCLKGGAAVGTADHAPSAAKPHSATAFRPASVMFIHRMDFCRPSTAVRVACIVANPSNTSPVR